LLTFSEADLSLWRLVFYFHISNLLWHFFFYTRKLCFCSISLYSICQKRSRQSCRLAAIKEDIGSIAKYSEIYPNIHCRKFSVKSICDISKTFGFKSLVSRLGLGTFMSRFCLDFCSKSRSRNVNVSSHLCLVDFGQALSSAENHNVKMTYLKTWNIILTTQELFIVKLNAYDVLSLTWSNVQWLKIGSVVEHSCWNRSRIRSRSQLFQSKSEESKNSDSNHL